MQNDVVWIVTEEEPLAVPDGQRGEQSRNPFGEPGFTGTSRTKQTPVPVAILEQNMTHLLQQVERMFNYAKQSATELASMELHEVELAVEINAEGQVSLLGSGSKIGGKGTMTLKFKLKE
ncbi:MULTISPECIES: Pepco domain-containing protein [Cyanophyceae]|uniref:Pepco domain-containing protein n=1 Tax=Cyanophyceae TaxID=3028117 RepID=UPI0016826F40|nr:hypothetical protein [Trichocoleus sp. FACHB-69]MBD1833301.1 hypothetical protein [Cyanobacteria bacterium FACHB-472]MBD1930305.1 hypothetical protein [Trichocoleus sp. FACHB-69]